jgi:hypothetical protein
MIRRFVTVLTLSSVFSTATYAEVMKEKSLNFTIKSESFKKDIHYSFAQGNAKILKQKFPDLAKLDSFGFLKNKSSSVIVAKVAYVVKKPIGFFDHENLVDQNFVSKLLGDQKIERTSPNSFDVKIPGPDKVSYKLKIFVDSDDVSTLPRSKVPESVAAFKRLDVISQSAPSISFKEMSDFNSYAWGAVSVSSYIPLKEDRTLIITYYLTSLKAKGSKKENEADMVDEFKATQKTIETFN